jgi:GMP synthase-like glutamine amidotransferase
MKKNLLLINCYREKAEEKIKGYREWLHEGAAAAGMQLAISDASDRPPMPAAGEFSALLVSGSQKMVGDGEVEAGLLEFLAGNRRPLLGICYGHQVLARAFGCLVTRDGKKHLGDEDIDLKKADRLFSGFPAVFKMRESHEEIVARDPALEGNFHVLAHNASGRVEAIVHREYPLYGVQFHPEKSGDLGIKLLVNFLKMLNG